jgi:hypothetical protein
MSRSGKRDLVGHRVYPTSSGFLDPTAMAEPGAYGRTMLPAQELADHPRLGWWEVTAPDGTQGSINPEKHQVIEHADGSITITPSLDYSKLRSGGWHGYLTRGIFTEV